MAKKTAPKKTPAKKSAAKAGDVVTQDQRATGLASINRDIREIEILPSPRAAEAIALRATADAIVVTDKASHTNALVELRGGKALKRDIENHWKEMKRPVSDLLTHVRDLEREELEPALEGLAILDKKTNDYEAEDAARVAREAEENRVKAEAIANADRAREVKAAEDQALALESMTSDLSAREAAFVESVVAGTEPMAAAKRAGYVDPAGRSSILLATPKIQKAMAAMREAAMLREQATARAAQPVLAIPQEVVSGVGKVAGVSKRRYYSCATQDRAAMLEAWKRGEIPAEAFAPNLPYLNDEAGRIKDPALFAAAYPGCTLTWRDGHAG